MARSVNGCIRRCPVSGLALANNERIEEIRGVSHAHIGFGQRISFHLLVLKKGGHPVGMFFQEGDDFFKGFSVLVIHRLLFQRVEGVSCFQL